MNPDAYAFRPMTAADLDRVGRWLKTPEVARWWDVPDPGFPLPTEPGLGVTFDEAWSTHETVPLEARAIPFIGRDAFIRNKEAAGRPKELADAARLRRARS